MSSKTEVRVVSQLAPYTDSEQPIIILISDEEDRVIKTEEATLLGSKRRERIYTWNFLGDTVDRKSKAAQGEQNETNYFVEKSPSKVLEWFSKEYNPTSASTNGRGGLTIKGQVNMKADNAMPSSVLIMRDVMFYMKSVPGSEWSDPGLTRLIQEINDTLMKQKKTLVLLSRSHRIPPELKHFVAVVEYPLPDHAYMKAHVNKGRQWFAPSGQENNPDAYLQMSDSELDETATLLVGLRGWEAENVLARATTENGRRRLEDSSVEPGYDLETIRNAKVASIQGNPALTIVIPKTSKEQKLSGAKRIGGASTAKDWFDAQRQLFHPDALADGIDQPKGSIIFGPGGCGKDHFVECLAQEINWTTLYADFGAAKGPLQGESHRGFRDIIKAAEMQSPCFLVISEWEKMMAGAFSGRSEFQTEMEIYASFLNWMQRRTKPVYVWALTNGIEKVPQPALRSGRWDRIWFMDLPNLTERKEIFSIHLENKGWNPEKYELDLDELAAITDGYTGSEISKVISNAITQKYLTVGPRSRGGLLQHSHLKEAIDTVTSTMVLDPSGVQSLRKYAKDGGFAYANSPEGKTTGKGKKRAGKDIAQLL